jgi:hypothetical protein
MQLPPTIFLCSTFVCLTTAGYVVGWSGFQWTKALYLMGVPVITDAVLRVLRGCVLMFFLHHSDKGKAVPV